MALRLDGLPLVACIALGCLLYALLAVAFAGVGIFAKRSRARAWHRCRLALAASCASFILGFVVFDWADNAPLGPTDRIDDLIYPWFAVFLVGLVTICRAGRARDQNP